MMTSANIDDRLLWSWEAFFRELHSLFRWATRQYGVANESSSHRTVERIQAGIISLSSLSGHLQVINDSGRILIDQ